MGDRVYSAGWAVLLVAVFLTLPLSIWLGILAPKGLDELIITIAAFGGSYGLVALLARIIPSTPLGAYPLILAPARFVPTSMSQAETVVRGRIRRLHDLVTSHLSAVECVASCLLLKGFGANAYLRHVRAARFVLEADDGEMIVVSGELWVEGDDADVDHDAEDIDTAVDELGLEHRCRIPARISETLLRDGDRVEIQGTVVKGVNCEVARTYRDGGTTRMMSGTVGNPLFIRPAPHL